MKKVRRIHTLPPKILVPDIRAHSSYLETKYGITVNVVIPDWWDEHQRKCWEILDKMYLYLKRYQAVWWSRPPSRSSALLHEVEKWHRRVIRWISMKREEQSIHCSLILHSFSLAEVLNNVFASPSDFILECKSGEDGHNVEVDCIEDRSDYLQLYAQLLNELRLMISTLE